MNPAPGMTNKFQEKKEMALAQAAKLRKESSVTKGKGGTE